MPLPASTLEEQDAIFQALTQDRFFDHLPCVLVTAKGHPDLATRVFCSKLVKSFPSLQVLGLVDWNPSGTLAFTRFYDDAACMCCGLPIALGMKLSELYPWSGGVTYHFCCRGLDPEDIQAARTNTAGRLAHSTPSVRSSYGWRDRLVQRSAANGVVQAKGRYRGALQQQWNGRNVKLLGGISYARLIRRDAASCAFHMHASGSWSASATEYLGDMILCNHSWSVIRHHLSNGKECCQTSRTNGSKSFCQMVRSRPSRSQIGTQLQAGQRNHGNKR
eukprot:362984-Chlamydomonas_euryale.AAC.9